MTATLDRRADFVSAVAVELADLAPDDRAELIEELDDHVAALLEDRPDADLVAELGTPRAYAAELRAAGGLSGGPVAKPTLRATWTAWVRGVDARVPAGLRPWLATLRPTWWALRGYLLVTAVGLWLGETWAGSGVGVLLPAPGGSWVLGIVVTLLGAAASLRLGAWRPGRTVRVLVGLLGLLALVGGGVLAQRAQQPGPEGLAEYQTQYVPNCPVQLGNLYAYDASGKPLSGVRLYDQNGNPFDLSVFGCQGGSAFSPSDDGPVNAYPWPSASADQYAPPTGPPASVSPLPGATVTS